MLRDIDHFIAGQAFASSGRTGDVFDPNQGEVQAKVKLGTAAELQKAVDAAKAAQPAWAATNPQRRARVFFRFRELVEKNMDELAQLLSSEHGKVLADSRGDVQQHDAAGLRAHDDRREPSEDGTENDQEQQTHMRLSKRELGLEFAARRLVPE